MIGQKRNLQTVKNWIDDYKFPQFLIIMGEKGSGKKTLMNVIANNWRFSYTCDDVKTDTIRTMIKFAYQSTERCVYLIPDVDTARPNAKGSLLKIIEEPPKNATFIMTSSYPDGIYSTILSRGRQMIMDSYSMTELDEAIKGESLEDEDREYLLSIANTVYDTKRLLTVDLDALRKQVSVLIDKCDTLSYGNLLKSSNNIAFKDEEDKIPLDLFCKAFMKEIENRILKLKSECLSDSEYTTKSLMYADMASRCNTLISDIRVSTINKQMAYEDFLLRIRYEKEMA